MASSRWLAGRPRMPSMASASASVSPRARCRGTSVLLAGALDMPAAYAAPRWPRDERSTREMGTLRTIPIPFVRMAAKRTRTPMSDDHKAALAEGRNQCRAVRRNLEALEAHKPKRGRKRTPESIEKRLDRTDAELDSADAPK